MTGVAEIPRESNCAGSDVPIPNLSLLAFKYNAYSLLSPSTLKSTSAPLSLIVTALSRDVTPFEDKVVNAPVLGVAAPTVVASIAPLFISTLVMA